MCEQILEALYLFFWPLISMILGLIGGSLFGVFFTIVITLMSLYRLPFNLYQTYRVAIITTEIFEGHFGWLMRGLCLIFIPVPHLLFVAAMTVASCTIGTLFYIGRATKIVYKHEYKKTMKQAGENARMEPKSYMGKYWKRQMKFWEQDQDAETLLKDVLKFSLSIIPGLIWGVLPFIPFTCTILFISVIRLPINMYKTMKITLITVVLKWDLKILTFVTLPVFHVTFVVVVTGAALICNLFYFIGIASHLFYKGKNPLKLYEHFETLILQYQKIHQEFSGGFCETYDHPTGIPEGWRGQAYGIPVRKILKIQWKFMLACFFTGYSIIITCLLTSLISVVKLIPIEIRCLYEYIKSYCKQSCAVILASWPFFLVGIPLLIKVVPVVLVCAVVVCSIWSLNAVHDAVTDQVKQSFFRAFEISAKFDEYTRELTNFRILCWDEDDCLVPDTRPACTMRTHAQHTTQAVEYWDLFIYECVVFTQELIQKKWINLEDVQCVDPSVVQSIPMIAVLKILARSIPNPQHKHQIVWADGTVCHDKTRPDKDGVVACLWPMIKQIKFDLMQDQKLYAVDNLEMIIALILSNAEEEFMPEDLKKFLAEKQPEKFENYQANNQIRSKLNNLMLGMSRVHPYQSRMNKIYEFDYGKLFIFVGTLIDRMTCLTKCMEIRF